VDLVVDDGAVSQTRALVVQDAAQGGDAVLGEVLGRQPSRERLEQ
jgi:hypothetical protein